MESQTGPRVLVVEDDPFWQRVIQRNLEKASETCSISFAENARDAMALLGHPKKFQLIISDQYLDEGKTGYEFWFECRKRGVRAPFLLTSGYTRFADDIRGGLPLKFVSKPFVAGEFRTILRSLLGSSRAETPFSDTIRLWLADEDVRAGVSILFATLSLLTLVVYHAQQR